MLVVDSGVLLTRNYDQKPNPEVHAPAGPPVNQKSKMEDVNSNIVHF